METKSGAIITLMKILKLHNFDHTIVTSKRNYNQEAPGSTYVTSNIEIQGNYGFLAFTS